MPDGELLAAYLQNGVRRRRARAAFGLSCTCSAALHSAVVALIFTVSVPHPSAVDPNASSESYVPVISVESRKHTRVVWYSLRNEPVPAIRPADGVSRAAPTLHARSEQRIVTAPANAPGEQYVSVPAPEIEVKPKLQVPNLLALAQEEPALARPRTRSFVPPAQTVTAEPAVREVRLAEPPPDIRGAQAMGPPATIAVPLNVYRLPRRNFVAPDPSPESTRTPKLVLPDAPPPDVEAQASLQAGPRLPRGPRQFMAPAARPAAATPSPSAESAGAAPTLHASLRLESDGTLRVVASPAVRAAPPPGTGSSTGREVAAVSLSANPATSQQIPANSQLARVATGRVSGSGTGLPGTDGRLAMPGVSVTGPAAIPRGAAAPVASEPPTGPRRSGGPSRLPLARTVSTPLWPQARSLKPVVESRFRNRAVYVTLVSSPLPASSDWMVWFGEQETAPSQTPPMIRPPLLADGAALLTLAPPATQVTLFVAGVIGRDGSFLPMALLDADPERFRSILGALESVRFSPVTRNDQAIAVDAVLEISLLPASRLVQKR